MTNKNWGRGCSKTRNMFDRLQLCMGDAAMGIWEAMVPLEKPCVRSLFWVALVYHHTMCHHQLHVDCTMIVQHMGALPPQNENGFPICAGQILSDMATNPHVITPVKSTRT